MIGFHACASRPKPPLSHAMVMPGTPVWKSRRGIQQQPGALVKHRQYPALAGRKHTRFHARIMVLNDPLEPPVQVPGENPATLDANPFSYENEQ